MMKCLLQWGFEIKHQPTRWVGINLWGLDLYSTIYGMVEYYDLDLEMD
jgi:hypothetical protein